MIYLNGEAVPVTHFPDGTSQVWKLDEKHLKIGADSHVKWDFSHEAEFFHLAQLRDILALYHQNVFLTISYLPYARQDKPVSNSATFALNTFGKILREMRFGDIEILDPHSPLIMHIVGANDVYPKDALQRVIKMTESSIVCYPDKGALNKYTQVYDWLGDNFAYGEKVRDQATGNITHYALSANGKDLKEHNVLIVDDICDGGATFLILAKSLRDAGVPDVNLFVTHGIFSKGVKILKQGGISRVFTYEGEIFHDSRGWPNSFSIERFN
jgi:ribose-phosphate pyrophosphokinase